MHRPAKIAETEDDRRECGWLSLAFAPLDQAVWDLMALRAAGAIVDNKPREPWPHARDARGYMVSRKLFGTYSNPGTVFELLAFLRGVDLDRYLQAIGAETNADVIRKGLAL